MIDLDASLYVEYDDGTKEPLALVETAVDRGQGMKASTVTRKLAERANLPAYTLLFRLADTLNPADSRWHDIACFRYRRIWPKPHTTWMTCTPVEWAKHLVLLRQWSARIVDQRLGLNGYPILDAKHLKP
jgi:hypothetical protein